MTRADITSLQCPTSGCKRLIVAPSGIAPNALRQHLRVGHALSRGEVDRLMHRLHLTFNPGAIPGSAPLVGTEVPLDLDTNIPVVPDLSKEKEEEEFWDRFHDYFWNNFWPTFWDLLEDSLTTRDLLDKPARRALAALSRYVMETPIALKKSEEDAFWTTPVEWDDEKREANP